MSKILNIYWAIMATVILSAPSNIYAKVTNPQPASSANNTSANLNKAKEAFYNYNFNTAANLFRQAGMNNKEENWEGKARIAANAFERVQQIVVVDSLNVPRAAFYKAFRLPLSAGKIGRPAELGLKKVSDSEEVSYLSEDKDYLITAEANDEGELVLVENRKLLDGTWESMIALDGDFETDGDYAFPFLCGDGQTLYFANNGEGSMGGFDLFVVQKEPITGETLQPLNLGMPFNSPYDDLMITIDEENGIGWWATDRNDPEGDITVYVYILDEVRKNYPSDTPNLKSFARLDNYKDTQEGHEEQVEQILKKIKTIR